VERVVIGGQEQVAGPAGPKRRRQQKMREAHPPAAVEMIAPGCRPSPQQWMEIIYRRLGDRLCLAHYRQITP
jgi:hypothetical protein